MHKLFSSSTLYPSKSHKLLFFALIVQTSRYLARALEDLLETVLAVGVRLLQIILLLVQVRHLLGQSLTLRFQSLLHIWDRCAHEPNILLLLPSWWGRVTGFIHLSNTLVHLCVGRQ
jgi:hypothetical protein